MTARRAGRRSSPRPRRAIVERGPGKLTLSAIAASAGVSRPTLYRWFSSKEDLLAALALHEEEQFDLGLREVLEAYANPSRRLDAALHYLVTYLDGLMGPDPIGTDVEAALRGSYFRSPFSACIWVDSSATRSSRSRPYGAGS